MHQGDLKKKKVDDKKYHKRHRKHSKTKKEDFHTMLCTHYFLVPPRICICLVLLKSWCTTYFNEEKEVMGKLGAWPFNNMLNPLDHQRSWGKGVTKRFQHNQTHKDFWTPKNQPPPRVWNRRFKKEQKLSHKDFQTSKENFMALRGAEKRIKLLIIIQKLGCYYALYNQLNRWKN